MLDSRWVSSTATSIPNIIASSFNIATNSTLLGMYHISFDNPLKPKFPKFFSTYFIIYYN